MQKGKIRMEKLSKPHERLEWIRIEAIYSIGTITFFDYSNAY